MRPVSVSVTAIAAFFLIAGSAGATLPTVSASAFVVETSDGVVLAERQPTERRAIASMTKLMTVLVALQHASLRDVVVVSPEAADVGESTIDLRPGQRLTVRDLAIAALVPSANDAATALASYVGGGSVERFVGLMNREARTLGLKDTHFANPHGLDQRGHYSSARDTARLLRAALEVPFIRHWAGATHATLSNGLVVESTDDLLRGFPPLVAGKTGHTDSAGWSQVALAERHGVGIVAAVLGAPDEDHRNRDLEGLLKWGFAQFRPVLAIDGRREYARVPVGWGKDPVPVVASRPATRELRIGRALVEQVATVGTAALPVGRGQRLGEVRVYDGGQLIARSPLVAARAVARPGVVDQGWWLAGRTVHHLFGFAN